MGCFCGYAAKNANQAYFFDLDAFDPQELIKASDAELTEVMCGETRPLRSISINKVPMLLQPVLVSDEQRRRAQVLAQSHALRQRLIATMTALYTADVGKEGMHIEQQIFGGFYGSNDKARLKEFQAADWSRRQEIVATFKDTRLRQLGSRLVAFYAPYLLSDSERRQHISWCRERWNAPSGRDVQWMTFEHARQVLSDIRATEEFDAIMLDEIETFIVNLETNAAGNESV
jgi:exodeoxyribonuclease I